MSDKETPYIVPKAYIKNSSLDISGNIVPIPKERAKDIELAKTLAREHYERFEGRLPILGDIEHYIYHDGFGSLYEIGLDNKIKKLIGLQSWK
ncbi:MAG: hypothetical protein ACLFQJ_09425 [Campylobacterales bacterium]